MSTHKDVIKFTVYGEPCSKANSRRLVTIRSKPAFIKSKKALAYVNDFHVQCPQLQPPISGDVAVRMTIYYSSRRPDLDESLILDCMQSVKQKKTVLRNNIYLNDRQVKEKHIYWGLDKENPRTEIEVWNILTS
jgi:hypothetical protein